MSRAATALRRPLVAGLVLLAAYLALSLLNDPRGYLGTDTGGKVATLKVMAERRHADPDVGYWAERWDPGGRLHPLYYTSHLAGKWVNLTTLPAALAAYPLYRLGGYRLALLLPMLGAVAAALAARRLARWLGGGEGWAAFWVVGLASPLAVYALDFWEHAIGVALIAWGVVCLLEALDGGEGRSRLVLGAGAGLLFGAAATMRTEALVYGAVATALTCVALLVRSRRLPSPLLLGVAVAAGLAVPLLANMALERAVIGTGLRAERASGSAVGALSGSGAGPGRVAEAALTGLSPTPTFGASAYLMGLALLLLVAYVAFRSGSRDGARPAAVALAGVAAIYAVRASDGLGFVPGLVAATPLAAVGLARGWTQARRRLVLAVAVVSLPLVWAFQYGGGAPPQWAGRYILPSGFLLGVVGVVCLPLLSRWAAAALVGFALAVTAFGVAWLSSRSHDVARAEAVLNRRPEPVLVSRLAHLAREGGAFYGDHRWLTAVTADDEGQAAAVVADAGFDTFGLVELAAAARPHDIAGFRRTTTATIRFFPDVPLRVTTYRR